MEPILQNMRILCKGKIEDLAKGFTLPGNKPFSVYVMRKDMPTMETALVAECKLLCDKEAGMFPLSINDWTPAAIVEIAPNAIDLNIFDVYWGAGNINI